MAMTDDMDELLRLYRHASTEAPQARMDDRILRAAENVSTLRRWRRRAVWPVAIAASWLLWASVQGVQHQTLAHDPMAGYDAGRTQAELLQMDVTPPHNDVDHFLMNANATHTTGNAP